MNEEVVYRCGKVLLLMHAHDEFVFVSPASHCVNVAWALKVRETEIDTVIDSSVSFSAK